MQFMVPHLTYEAFHAEHVIAFVVNQHHHKVIAIEAFTFNTVVPGKRTSFFHHS